MYFLLLIIGAEVEILDRPPEGFITRQLVSKWAGIIS
jgi:hypothetical protein